MKLETLIGGREFKVNAIIRALFRSPTAYSSVFYSRCPTWISIYIRSWVNLHGVENSGEEMRLFGVGHEDIQSYPKRGIAIRSVLLRISALSGAQFRIKSYSDWNKRINFDNHTLRSQNTLSSKIKIR